MVGQLLTGSSDGAKLPQFFLPRAARAVTVNGPTGPTAVVHAYLHVLHRDPIRQPDRQPQVTRIPHV